MYRTKRISKIRLHKTLFTCCTLSLTSTSLEYRYCFIHICKQLNLSFYIFVVICIEEVVYTMTAHNHFVSCDWNSYTCIYLIWVRVNTSVKLSKSIHWVQIVRTNESTYFCTISQNLTISTSRQVTHIVKDYTHVANIFLIKSTECFKAFTLTSSTITHDNDIGCKTTLKCDINHSTVDRKISAFHLLDVMQSEQHLLHIAEVIDIIAVVSITD